MFNFGKKRKNYGSSSGRYFSSSIRRSGLAYSRVAKNRSMSIKSLLSKILLILVFAGVGYALFFSPVFKASKINVSGNNTVSADEIRSVAENISNRKVYRFFNNNLILIKSEEIEKAIREKFNNVSSASAVKKFPQTLDIVIVEKPADILWCNRIKVEKISSAAKIAESGQPPTAEEASHQEASQCFFGDELNMIYAKSQDGAASPGIRIFRDDPIAIGDRIADESLKNFIRTLARDFNFKTGLEYSYLYLPAISSRELHLVTKGGWKIFFDLNRPAEDQLDVLNSVWREAIPEKYKNDMEYIDLRVQDRVPWKPRNEPQM